MRQQCHFFFFYLVLIAGIPQTLQIRFIFSAISISSSGGWMFVLIVSVVIIAYLCTFNILLKNAFLSKNWYSACAD